MQDKFENDWFLLALPNATPWLSVMLGWNVSGFWRTQL